MLTGIAFTHTDFLILFVVIILTTAYCFLRIMGVTFGFSFLTDHWGDCVGLLLIFLGVALILIAPVYTNETNSVQVTTTGSGLITAGFIALKLKTVPSSTNGGTQTTETHTMAKTPIAPVPAPPNPVPPAAVPPAPPGP